MSKTRTSFFCQNCGVESSKWVGKCPSCGEWNTLVEEIVAKQKNDKETLFFNSGSKPVRLEDINSEESPRIDLRSIELNRVLGGGLVPGSLVLLGGEPGIGKSTLVLQLSLRLKNRKILYVSGEESMHQIKLRSERIGAKNENCYLLSETYLENIFTHVKNLSPEFVVIDSIQTISTDRIDSSPGSVSQIRECTAEILRFAKSNNIPFILIGHINKEGTIAGPKVLEHIVDTVLQFEGDREHFYRILRTTKNRFGSTSEIGIFEMQNNGLREVNDTSELLISGDSGNFSGTAISATIEGNRSILIEVQALVSTAAYGTPQRSSTGFDLRRLNMLLAVLEKRAGFRLSNKDVFINLAGGVKVNDPSIDLGVITAVMSSNFDVNIPGNYCFAGEVGLTGEIRPLSRIEQRISEASKLGFKRIYISEGNRKNLPEKPVKIEIIFVKRVEEVFKSLFSK